jgi:hypothetical protein
MRIQLSKNRKWSLYGAVVTAMAYSALTLTSQPAYAGACTPTYCPYNNNLNSGAGAQCASKCNSYSDSVIRIICPTNGYSSFGCICWNPVYGYQDFVLACP